MRIVMIGAGYVGLVSGACFAELGHRVTCVDHDARKIALLKRGHVPIFEPDLERLVERNTEAGRIDFATEPAGSVDQADAVFIAVGTPSRINDGHTDLTYVYAAVREIAGLLKDGAVVITKSTVPVGTCDEVERQIRDINQASHVTVAANPEFLREGAAIRDFMNPDRIIVGAQDDSARAMLAEIYRPLTAKGVPLMQTGRRTAELIKYTANAFLAMKITFINEIADLAERIGADVEDVSRGIGLDQRIGAQFLRAGPGIGGSCFPKDTRALVRTAHDYDVPLRIVESVMLVNDARKRAMSRKILAALNGNLRGRTVAVLGLTFKPDTDDIRESPAIPLITALKDMGAHVRAYDPVGMEPAREEITGIELCADAYACAYGADALVIVTEWRQFFALDLDRLKREMARPVIVDLRNIFDPHDMRARGFIYDSVGRPIRTAPDGA
jgi:UDPglucose 6-dehydrogenase